MPTLSDDGLNSLEDFVEESLRRCVARGYHPTAFLEMRAKYGLVEATRRLVENSEIQSGFSRLKDMNMLEWTLEAGVIRFPERFTKQTREYAGFRLSQAKGRKLRGLKNV